VSHLLAGILGSLESDLSLSFLSLIYRNPFHFSTYYSLHEEWYAHEWWLYLIDGGCLEPSVLERDQETKSAFNAKESCL
jgi:hypothetical protein